MNRLNKIFGRGVVLSLIGLAVFALGNKLSLAQDSSKYDSYNNNFVLEEGEQIPRSKASQNYHQQINEILAHEDFGKEETRQSWRFKKSEKEDDDEWDLFPDWLADLFDLNPSSVALLAGVIEVLLWLAAAAILVWLVFKLKDELPNLFSPDTAAAEPELPASLFGVELERTQLPTNIVEQAQQLWHAGERREALSLLLRGSLVRVLESYPCHLFDSDTENECLAKIQQASPSDISSFMKSLIECWQTLAYAHREPQEMQFSHLCNVYQEVF